MWVGPDEEGRLWDRHQGRGRSQIRVTYFSGLPPGLVGVIWAPKPGLRDSSLL